MRAMCQRRPSWALGRAGLPDGSCEQLNCPGLTAPPSISFPEETDPTPLNHYWLELG